MASNSQHHQHSPLSLSLSLKQNLKFICCNFCDNDGEEELDVQKVPEHSRNNRKCLTSMIAWLKSEFPEIKTVFAGKHKRNRRCNSSEFRYDPLSYALNFEDDDSHLDEFPLRNFSSRLPPSPVKENRNGVV